MREFKEEVDVTPVGPFQPLKPIAQRGGKQVYAWHCQGDLDAAAAKSNTFTLEWPPKTGRYVALPEIDKAEFF